MYSSKSEESKEKLADFSELDILKILSRLNKTKLESDKINKRVQKERLKEMEEINKRMGVLSVEETEDFIPYENIQKGGVRRRSRGLTFQENIELQKYQKRIGIQPKIPHINQNSTIPLCRPIGKPTAAPVIPLPGQKFVHPSITPSNSGQGHQRSPPAPSGPPAPPNYRPSPVIADACCFPNKIPAQPVFPPTAEKSKKKPTGLKRWFGFAK